MITVILAGGLGKRMESSLPKVLHKVDDLPMIVHVIKTSQSESLNSEKTLIIVGIYKDVIKNIIDTYIDSGFIKNNIEYVIQPEPLGTGHAIKCVLPYLYDYKNKYALILSGDVPLISEETLFHLCNDNINKNSILITKLDNPYGCGRIIFNNNEKDEKEIIEIIEEKDCTSSQKDINYVNCGIYHIKIEDLIEIIPKIENNNASKEYYLTDFVKLYNENNNNNIGLGYLGYYLLEKDKQFEIKNVNDRFDLYEINQYFLRCEKCDEKLNKCDDCQTSICLECDLCSKCSKFYGNCHKYHQKCMECGKKTVCHIKGICGECDTPFHKITDTVTVGSCSTSYNDYDLIFNLNYPENGVRLHNISQVFGQRPNGHGQKEEMKKHYYVIGMYDRSTSEDLSIFRESIRILKKVIEEQKQTGKDLNILFHCFAGYSRSVALAIAYISLKEGISVEDAFNMVKEKRKYIGPNKEFIKIVIEECGEKIETNSELFRKLERIK